VKLEGRMKRPEYVAIVTGVYSRAIREGREPSAEELEMLRLAFSRDGFTDGYFLGKTGAHMFGVRKDEDEPKELFAQVRAGYESGEGRKEPVRMFAMIQKGQPVRVGVQDRQERVATVTGPVPEAAIHVPLTIDKVEGQLSRTGGTPYACEKVTALVEEGLSLPLSVLNGLRRDVLDKLSEQRVVLPNRRKTEFKAGVRYENRRVPPAITVSVRTADQISADMLAMKPERLYIPVDEGAAHPEKVTAAIQAGVAVCAVLPRIFWDRERDAVKSDLLKMKELGVTEALVATPGAIRLAQELEFDLRADYGLGVFNSQTQKELKRLGFVSATASFELNFAQIRDMSKAIDTEILA
jgi:putative protease